MLPGEQMPTLLAPGAVDAPGERLCPDVRQSFDPCRGNVAECAGQ